MNGVTLMFGWALWEPALVIPIRFDTSKNLRAAPTAGAGRREFCHWLYDAGAGAGAAAPPPSAAAGPFFLSATRPIWSMPESRMMLMVSTTVP